MWQVTDQIEATSFAAELLKCGNSVQHFIVYERQKFSSQNQASMIYKDLRESYSLHRERTQYFMPGDRCFGHLPVVGCLPDEYVCQILSQVTAFFARFRKHSSTAKCNFVAG